MTRTHFGERFENLTNFLAMANFHPQKRECVCMCLLYCQLRQCILFIIHLCSQCHSAIAHHHQSFRYYLHHHYFYEHIIKHVTQFRASFFFLFPLQNAVVLLSFSSTVFPFPHLCHTKMNSKGQRAKLTFSIAILN